MSPPEAPSFPKVILTVDDEPVIRRVLCGVLQQAGYKCYEASCGKEAIKILDRRRIDLVLLDIKMPGDSGLEILQNIQRKYSVLPVIMITAVSDTEMAVNCMKIGASDYITKPFDLGQVLHAVAAALEQQQRERKQMKHKARLERQVLNQADRIRLSFVNAVTSLVNALEAKDRYTGGHSRRVSSISTLMALEMGLTRKEIEIIRLAGLVHDVGKIGISEAILNKPGKLTEMELDKIKAHPRIGQKILAPLTDKPDILKIVRAHHERWDGSGYPDCLVRDAIPLGARIIAVADSFEAMTADRAYRCRRAALDARAEIQCACGTQFDANSVQAFLDCFDKVLKL